MRITKYVKSDGQNWMKVQIRCSAQVSYNRLDKLMTQNGWVRWNLLREKFNELKKKVARENPTKYPNWKEVKIPMYDAKKKDLPSAIVGPGGRELAVVDGAANG